MTWDDFVRVWAIAGPLLVGAAAAIWNRWTKGLDRQYEEGRLAAQREFETTKQHSEGRREKQKAAAERKRAAIRDLLVNANAVQMWHRPADGRPKAEYADALSVALAEVCLSCGPDVVQAARRLHDKAHEVAKTLVRVDEERQFRDVRQAFIDSARFEIESGEKLL